MADRPAFLRHLDEAYLIAQVAAASPSDAENLVASAYARTGLQAEDRFALLSNLIRQILPPTVPAVSEASFATFLDESMSEAPASTEVPTSAIRSRVGRDLLGRYLLIAFTELPVRQRLQIALSVGSGRSVADAAMLLESTPDAVQRDLVASDRSLRLDATRLAPETERSLLASAALDERPVEAVERMIGTVVAPVNQRLERRILDLKPPVAAEKALPAPERPRSRLKAVLYALLLVLTAGAVGYAARELPRSSASASRSGSTSSVRDAVELVLRRASSVKPNLATDRPEEAERHLLSTMKWRLTVPAIEGARLVGVGSESLADSAFVPVLLYADDESDASFPVFVLSYAFLERTGGRIVMDRGVLEQIQIDGHFDVYDAGNRRALIFRHRDDIYLAVTRGSAQALRDRIRFPM